MKEKVTLESIGYTELKQREERITPHHDQPQQYISPFVNNTTNLELKLVLEAQKLLTELGYDTGPINGEYNEQTMAAVIRFESDHNKSSDGRLDDFLLNTIRHYASLAQSERKKENSTKPKQKKQRPSTIFAKGSPKQLVIKLQGEPDSVTPHHTYELLHYGYSFVKISLENRKVLSWSNTSNNLNVEE